MNIKPLGNRVIIKSEKRKEKILASGIIAATAYDKTEEVHGTVMAIGPTVETVKVGDLISFPMYGYDTVSDDFGNDFMSLREPDITAVLDRAPVDPSATVSGTTEVKLEPAPKTKQGKIIVDTK